VVGVAEAVQLPCASVTTSTVSVGVTGLFPTIRVGRC
jgi:hypothetical protein